MTELNGGFSATLYKTETEEAIKINPLVFPEHIPIYMISIEPDPYSLEIPEVFFNNKRQRSVYLNGTKVWPKNKYIIEFNTNGEGKLPDSFLNVNFNEPWTWSVLDTFPKLPELNDNFKGWKSEQTGEIVLTGSLINNDDLNEEGIIKLIAIKENWFITPFRDTGVHSIKSNEEIVDDMPYLILVPVGDSGSFASLSVVDSDNRNNTYQLSGTISSRINVSSVASPNKQNMHILTGDDFEGIFGSGDIKYDAQEVYFYKVPGTENHYYLKISPGNMHYYGDSGENYGFYSEYYNSPKDDQKSIVIETLESVNLSGDSISISETDGSKLTTVNNGQELMYYNYNSNYFINFVNPNHSLSLSDKVKNFAIVPLFQMENPYAKMYFILEEEPNKVYYFHKTRRKIYSTSECNEEDSVLLSDIASEHPASFRGWYYGNLLLTDPTDDKYSTLEDISLGFAESINIDPVYNYIKLGFKGYTISKTYYFNRDNSYIYKDINFISNTGEEIQATFSNKVTISEITKEIADDDATLGYVFDGWQHPCNNSYYLTDENINLLNQIKREKVFVNSNFYREWTLFPRADSSLFPNIFHNRLDNGQVCVIIGNIVAYPIFVGAINNIVLDPNPLNGELPFVFLHPSFGATFEETIYTSKATTINITCPSSEGEIRYADGLYIGGICYEKDDEYSEIPELISILKSALGSGGTMPGYVSPENYTPDGGHYTRIRHSEYGYEEWYLDQTPIMLLNGSISNDKIKYVDSTVSSKAIPNWVSGNDYSEKVEYMRYNPSISNDYWNDYRVYSDINGEAFNSQTNSQVDYSSRIISIAIEVPYISYNDEDNKLYVAFEDNNYGQTGELNQMTFDTEANSFYYIFAKQGGLDEEEKYYNGTFHIYANQYLNPSMIHIFYAN